MPQKFSNAARALLTAAITPSATSFSVESSKADLFPVANAGTATLPSSLDWFKAVLQDGTGDYEIVYVRTRASGSATFSNVLRGQEGTTARSWAAGTVVGLRVTAGDMELPRHDAEFTGQTKFDAGTASAPSITRAGDTNTGVFFPANDTVSVSTDGSERLRIDSAGNVGIGTTSPSAKLHVLHTGNAPTLGPELVTNGSFTGNADGWTLGTNWSYSDGAIVLNNVGNSGSVTQNITVQSGKTYRVSFSMTQSVSYAAAIEPFIGSVSGGLMSRTILTTPATLETIITANTTGSVPFTLSVVDIANTGTITIDNVSVKEITSAAPAAVIGDASNPAEVRQNSGSIFIGRSAGSLSANAENTAVGYWALRRVRGGANTAVGREALSNNTAGANNVALGAYSLRDNLSGSENVAVGRSSLLYNSIGAVNVAVGTYSLMNNTTGHSNVAVGNTALFGNTIGSQNTAVGRDAGRYAGNTSTPNTTSSNSIYIGWRTFASADGNTNEVVIGNNAIGNGSNTVTLGNTSVTATYLRGAVIQPAGQVQTPTRSTVASGSTINLTTATSHLLYDNASTAESLTINLPSSNLFNGQIITICTRSAITSLTIGGGTIYGNVTTLPAGGFVSFIYSQAANAWFRRG